MNGSSNANTTPGFLQHLSFCQDQVNLNNGNGFSFFSAAPSQEASYLSSTATGVSTFPVQDLSGYTSVSYPQQVLAVNNGSVPVSPSQHVIESVISSPSQGFFDTQSLPASQQQPATGYIGHVQPFYQLRSSSPVVQQQPTYSLPVQTSLYDTLGQVNVFGNQASFQPNVSYSVQAAISNPLLQQLAIPQNVELINKLLLIEQLKVDNQLQYIRMQQLKLEQQQLIEKKLPEVVEINDDEVDEEDGSGNASGADESDDDEYVPEGCGNRRGSLQGAGNGRRSSHSSATTCSPLSHTFISPPASPNRRSSNAGNTQSAPSTPRRRQQLSPPQTPQRQAAATATTIAPIIVAKQQPGLEQPYILVRGARKSSWQRLEQMSTINSKPYKYCMRLVLPYQQATRSSSPYYRIQAEDLALRIISVDNSDPTNQQIHVVEDGVTLEKVVKTNTTSNGKEIDLRVCFHCYSHGFNRQGFCIDIIDTCENVVLMRSDEFKIYARRKRTVSGGSSGSSGKKRKTSHPGK